MKIDLCPESQYPHQTLINLIIAIVVIPVIVIIGLHMMRSIKMAIPKKTKQKYAIYAKARWR